MPSFVDVVVTGPWPSGFGCRSRKLGDAAFCQRDICQKILEGGGDYLMVVKDNQPNLHKAAQQAFAISRAPGKRKSGPLSETIGA